MSRIGSIQIKNTRVIDLVAEEQESHGAGRNTTEAAENLILAEIERRRIERASKPQRSKAQSAPQPT